MASFHKTNMKILRLKNRVHMCKRCGIAPAEVGGLCPTCREYQERTRRREAARKGKLKNGGLTGKPTPWPWPWLAHDCQMLISGKKGE